MLLYVTTSSEHMKTIVLSCFTGLWRFILFDVTEYQMRCYPSNLALFGASCQSKERRERRLQPVDCTWIQYNACKHIDSNHGIWDRQQKLIDIVLVSFFVTRRDCNRLLHCHFLLFFYDRQQLTATSWIFCLSAHHCKK